MHKKEDPLMETSYAVDQFLTELTTKTGFDILTINAIILARCTLAADYVGNGNNFRQMLFHVSNLPVSENRTLQ